MLTEGKGEDEEEESDESKKEEEPPKKKGKVIITKPQKQPTAVFTRRTRKGKKDSEPVFVRSTPTFEERMKELKTRVGICNFKALKYEIRTPDEQKEIEDLVMEKMGIWKYSPAQMQPQIHADLYENIKARWDFTTQIAKEIFEQQLRQLVPSLSDEEVKKALLEHEGRMILKLNTCFIFMDITESVIRQASDVWKDVYHLKQPSTEAMEIKDDDISDEDEHDNIPIVTIT